MKSIIVSALAFILSSNTFGQTQPGTQNLAVTVTNIQKTGKNLIFGIFRKSDPFLVFDKSWKTELVQANGPSVTISFEIPYGDYAIALTHDLNGNGKLDKNFFGVPKEPYGFSQNFHPKLSSPDFDDCKISFTTPNQAITIKLIN